jgi:Rrf2 family transcriptional regulator, iron-sulfur cluster assembly transcription factor
MYRYGKLTQNAVAALSRLAETYQEGEGWVSAMDIARSRNLPRPVLAKILTVLAQGGLVVGFRGPTGGYRLARPPATITLLDVVQLFERPDEDALGCPFGPGWCGRGAPCPYHDRITRLRQDMLDYLQNTDFGAFRGNAPSHAGNARGTGGTPKNRRR